MLGLPTPQQLHLPSEQPCQELMCPPCLLLPFFLLCSKQIFCPCCPTTFPASTAQAGATLFIPSPAAPITAPVRKTTTNVQHTLFLSALPIPDCYASCIIHQLLNVQTPLLQLYSLHSSFLWGKKSVCRTSAWNIKTTLKFLCVCLLHQFTMKTKASAASPWPRGPGGDRATAGHRHIRPSSLTGKLWLYCLPLNSAKKTKSFVKALSLKVFAVKIHRAKEREMHF